MESSLLHATRSILSQAFNGLSQDERNHLREWQQAARSVGVDGIEDLASRPWPCPIAGSVIGVFKAGSEAATWLVIGHNGTWAVAYCAENRVSPTFDTLAEALAAIYPARDGRIRPSLIC